MNGIELIAAERQRQIEVEGWTPEHDDGHIGGELSWAGGGYAMIGSAIIRGALASDFPERFVKEQGDWPGNWQGWWKPSDDPIRNLVKAGALIAAEIDRLQRLNDSPRRATA